MSPIIIILIVAIAGGVLLWRKIFPKKQPELDFSFGLFEARNTKTLLLTGKYDTLESYILQISPDSLTQTIDHLALTTDTNTFLAWLENSKNKDIARLCLGVHYLHKAWIARTHSTGAEVSEEQADLFFEYQELSFEQLSVVDASPKVMAETNSRLISLAKGMNDSESVPVYFQKAIAHDKTWLWAYIHYCEAIQPKWGGNLQLIADLRNQLPKVPIIQQVIESKLVLDSLIWETNYFGGTVEELQVKAKTLIEKIDKEITATPITSVNKYILYGQLFRIADFVGNKKLEDKYLKLIDGNYALHPFGLPDGAGG